MTDAVERIINLALLLATARAPLTADRIRREVKGYPPPREQDADAFRRMLERDKETLRAAGFVIECDAAGRYSLNAHETFVAAISLTAEERALIRAIGIAMLQDPSFPFRDDLRYALAKIAETTESARAFAPVRDTYETPGYQAETVARLVAAASSAKRISFGYTNSLGEHKHHEVEAYGLFARDGCWYLVGRDTAINEIRTYSVARTVDVKIDSTRPKSPDFVRPADFRVAAFIRHPFQFGSEDLVATIAFDPAQAWRAEALAAGIGDLAIAPDGSITWTVRARNRRRLLQWVVENGPGLEIISPSSLNRELTAGFLRVATTHGGNPDVPGPS